MDEGLPKGNQNIRIWAVRDSPFSSRIQLPYPLLTIKSGQLPLCRDRCPRKKKEREELEGKTKKKKKKGYSQSIGNHARTRHRAKSGLRRISIDGQTVTMAGSVQNSQTR